MRRLGLIPFLLALMLLPAAAQPGSAPSIPKTALIQPAELAGEIKVGAAPVILQVGFSVLYAEAHIPGAIYAGPTGKDEGIANLKNQVRALAKDKPLVIYCGCCPWEKCPNVDAAWKTLTDLGFQSVKVLYLASNFGADWADKGYPVVHGS
jgi:thiosulfate/3-mercaptopyruvate sulfurtransferase